MVPLWLFVLVVAVLGVALGVVAVQRDRARFQVGDLRAELGPVSPPSGSAGTSVSRWWT